MLKYTSQHIHDCLQGRRVVFARDSTIRQIFWATSAKLGNPNARDPATDLVDMGGKHENLSYGANNVTLEFLWDPWLNTTALKDELAKFVPQPYSDDGALLDDKMDSAALIVVGAPGLWAAHYGGGDDFYQLFRFRVDNVMGELMSPLEHNIKTSTISAPTNYNDSSNMILLAPVQVPAYDMLSSGREATITPGKIDLMNSYLSDKMPSEKSHMLWAHNKMTEGFKAAFDDSGLHVVGNVAANQADIVLNARCNNQRAASGGKGIGKGTCCTAYSRSRFETVFLDLGVVLSSLILCYKLLPGSVRRILRIPQVVVMAGQLLFAVAWSQFSDRTTLFSKIPRHYDQHTFLLLSAFWFLGSLLSLSLASLDGEPAYSDGFLSRKQSEEIKGSMQALILLYHYYFASQTLWVYKLVRLFMSGYFFLSAFGHSSYFLRKRDYSFGRVAIVIFRFNALMALLPYAVNNDYSSYYFAPAITFWYLVVYFTHRVYHAHNQNQFRFLIKVFVAAVLANVFISMPGLLEFVCKGSEAIFRMPWDVKELRFRLGLDRFIVFAGIITASIVQRMTRFRAYHREAGFTTALTAGPWGEPAWALDPLLRAIAREHPKWVSRKPFVLLLCAAALPVFFAFTSAHFLPSKPGYNALHPYISWLPILAFLALRNASPWVRKRYMRLPAALGRISLETYVLQYHMWLGNDATAKLATGLLDRYGSPLLLHGRGDDGRFMSAYVGRPMETIILTAFFVAVAAATHRATEVLAQRLFGPSKLFGPQREEGEGEEERRGRLRHRLHHHYRPPPLDDYTIHPLPLGGDAERHSSSSSNNNEDVVERSGGGAIAGPSSSSFSSDPGPSSVASERATLGTVFELVDLNSSGGGGGERRRQQGTSASISVEEIGGNNDHVVDVEQGRDGGRDNNNNNSSRGNRWLGRMKKVLPTVFITAFSRRRRPGTARFNIRGAGIIEDPRFRAAVLLSVLWAANWLYC